VTISFSIRTALQGVRCYYTDVTGSNISYKLNPVSSTNSQYINFQQKHNSTVF